MNSQRAGNPSCDSDKQRLRRLKRLIEMKIFADKFSSETLTQLGQIERVSTAQTRRLIHSN